MTDIPGKVCDQCYKFTPDATQSPFCEWCGVRWVDPLLPMSVTTYKAGTYLCVNYRCDHCREDYHRVILIGNHVQSNVICVCGRFAGIRTASTDGSRYAVQPTDFDAAMSGIRDPHSWQEWKAAYEQALEVIRNQAQRITELEQALASASTAIAQDSAATFSVNTPLALAPGEEFEIHELWTGKCMARVRQPISMSPRVEDSLGEWAEGDTLGEARYRAWQAWQNKSAGAE